MSQKRSSPRPIPLLALGAATLVLAACGGAEAGSESTSQALTGSVAFRCTQTTVSRGAYKQAVSGTLDASGVPHGVAVVRVATGAAEVSAASPALDPGFDGGYWKRTYGFDSWLLGTASSGISLRTYHLNMPTAPGSAFQAMLKTDFGPNGSDGNWQHWMACTSG
jgi:hypothetical protein